MDPARRARRERRVQGELQCHYPGACSNERAIKPNGERHWLCERHRERQNALQRARHQRIAEAKKRKIASIHDTKEPPAAVPPAPVRHEKRAITTNKGAATRKPRALPGKEESPQSRAGQPRKKRPKTLNAIDPARFHQAPLPQTTGESPSSRRAEHATSRGRPSSEGGRGECADSKKYSGRPSRPTQPEKTPTTIADADTRHLPATDRRNSELSTGREFHAIVVVVQTVPVPCVASGGEQPPRNTTQNTVASTVLRAITEALAAQPKPVASIGGKNSTQKHREKQ